MQLIGMLDSPFVRRVAITLQLLDLPFTHRPISVFRHVSEFDAVNPVVKVPTLICDDGTVLMDSTLIIDFAEAMAAARGGMSLMPRELAARQRALSVIGYAMAGCEKSVQILYELALRPADKRHEPWLTRVTAQTRAAFGGLEALLAAGPAPLEGDAIDQAGLTAAVAWHFTQRMQPDLLSRDAHPALARLSGVAEALPAFQRAPHGEGTVGS